MTSFSRATEHAAGNVVQLAQNTAALEAGILGRTKDQRGRLICWTADDYRAQVALRERSNRVGGADSRGGKPRLGPALPLQPPAGAQAKRTPPPATGFRNHFLELLDTEAAAQPGESDGPQLG